MSILYFIIPPILLLGIPNLLFLQIWKIPLIKKICKICFTPMVALIVFAVLFLLYHLPVVLNIFSQSPFVHNGYIFLLLLLSFSMWWPLVAPDPKKRFCKIQKKRYAFLSGLVLMPACILFIFNVLLGGMNNPFITQITVHLCTPSQAGSLNLLPFPFNTKYDQIMAGTLMLGIHKSSIMLSFHLGSRMQD